MVLDIWGLGDHPYGLPDTWGGLRRPWHIPAIRVLLTRVSPVNRRRLPRRLEPHLLVPDHDSSR